MSTSDNRAAGLYIHIPFCVRKCLYCDFVSTSAADGQYRRYVEAVTGEMLFWKQRFEGNEFATVYIGGGTPSLIGADLITQLLGELHHAFSISPDAEITIEVNPATISRDFWARIVKSGVNRVSIGVQSFSDLLLRTLGRSHDSTAAVQAVGDALEAGLTNVGIDLIYGIPGQTGGDWETTLETALKLKPAHISTYCLSYEKGTPFEKLRDNRELSPVAVEVESEMYYRALAILKASDYQRYEISNFAVPGFECRHNLNYWNFGDYLGIGVGAHSFSGGRRWENGSDIQRYLYAPYSGPLFIYEPLGVQDLLKEFLMVGLRKADGVSVNYLEKEWGGEVIRIMDTARRLEADGLVAVKDGRLCIADRGLFISNEIIAAFF